jgi:pimeloyl-ACP methyl ester carboxylesterase
MYNHKIIRKEYIEGLYGQIHIRKSIPIEKSKRPIVCFHASPLSGEIYDELILLIGKDRVVIAPDTPGYGMSDPPNNFPTIDDYAIIFSELLDTLNLNEVDVVGYATGSFIASALAALRPDAVRRVVLFSAPIIDDKERKKLGNRFGKIITPKSDGTHLIKLWKQVYEPRGPKQTLEDCMKIFPDHIRAPEKNKPWAPQAAFIHPLSKNLKEIKQPIVIYNIANDVHDSTALACDYINNGKLIEIPTWGHGFLQNETKEVNKILRLFFDKKKPVTI